MKHLATLIAMLLFTATLAFADESTANDTLEVKANHDAEARIQWFHDMGVELTESQKQKLVELVMTRDKAIAEFEGANAENLKKARAALNAAYASRNQAEMESASAAFRTLTQPMSKVYDNFRNGVETMLTPEQKAQRDDGLLTANIKFQARPIELTDTQIKKVKRLVGNRDAGHVMAAIQEALDSVVTVEQRNQSKKDAAIGSIKNIYARANLTAEQLKKIEGICDEMIQAQEPQEKIDIMELSRRVHELLTPEQKTAMHPATQSK